MADGRTPNFGLILPEGNRKNWTDKANGNFTLIDALIATYVSVTNLQGLWTNNTEYDVGDNVIDESSGVVYTAQVEHVSSSAPTTFLEEREDHPTYWLTFATAARNRGAWATNTAYALNDFVLADGTKYAMAISAHTSGANFTTDLAAGKWEVIIDLSTAGSLVLPVLSGGADANKVVMTDSGGNSYVINTMAALASLLNAAGLATLANPAFTGNPTAPTATAEDNDTSIATTAYADTAVRNMVIRRQTFSASGTYTPHAKMLYCDIECWGGGGGGGGSEDAGGAWRNVGGGGGAGSYSRALASKATIGASQVVTIGAGGTAGAAAGGTGGAGGDTSVGAICVGKGGSGGEGQVAAATNNGAGGAGGIAGTGDVTGIGMPGHYGGVETTSTTLIDNRGGSTSIGGGAARTAGSSGTGTTATGKGGGGSGGRSTDGGGNFAGGAGAAGYVIVTEFCYG